MATGKPFKPYQALSLNFNGLTNRIISDIGVTEVFDPNTTIKQPNLYPTKALWDTGATNSVITRETAEALKLVPIGKKEVNHAGGKTEHNTHLVNLFLPNQVGIVGVIVTEMEHIVGDFGVIVGMDVISKGDFSITNYDGKTCFSFRMPSLNKVDFVDDWNKKLKSIRPNDFCFCGSQKKFRKCHGQS